MNGTTPTVNAEWHHTDNLVVKFVVCWLEIFAVVNEVVKRYIGEGERGVSTVIPTGWAVVLGGGSGEWRAVHYMK